MLNVNKIVIPSPKQKEIIIECLTNSMNSWEDGE